MESIEKLEQAILLVMTYKNASPALLQRKMRIGYSRAVHMIAKMADLGILGEKTGVGGWPILVNSKEEALSKLDVGKKFKVIIAGGRDFKDYNLLISKCDSILKDKNNVVIISGGQRSIDKQTGEFYGTDYLGECYAEKRGYELEIFPADWKSLGKSAGPLRNKDMADYSDALIAFWDGSSRGTKNMIDLAKAKPLPTRILRY